MGQAWRCTYWVLKKLRRPHLAQVHLPSCSKQCRGWWKWDSFLLQVKSLHSGGDSAGITITWSPSAVPQGGSLDLLLPLQAAVQMQMQSSHWFSHEATGRPLWWSKFKLHWDNVPGSASVFRPLRDRKGRGGRCIFLALGNGVCHGSQRGSREVLMTILLLGTVHLISTLYCTWTLPITVSLYFALFPVECVLVKWSVSLSSHAFCGCSALHTKVMQPWLGLGSPETDSW